jgi:hypothetical protein
MSNNPCDNIGAKGRNCTFMGYKISYSIPFYRLETSTLLKQRKILDPMLVFLV